MLQRLAMFAYLDNIQMDEDRVRNKFIIIIIIILLFQNLENTAVIKKSQTIGKFFFKVKDIETFSLYHIYHYS